MNTYWKINTRGDPLGAVHHLLQKIWEIEALDGFLAPINGEHEASTRAHLMDKPEQLTRVNPFKPLMVENLARLVPEITRRQPGKRIGVLLRPCEMRALIEMAKRDSFKLDNLLTVCVDCLGTFPAEEYQWRVARKGNRDGLSDESVQFSRQGGILAYRYRAACQMCTSPQATGANLNINLIGLPARHAILVSTGDSLDLHTNGVSDGHADEMLIQQHMHTLARMKERTSSTMERVKSSLSGFVPSNVDELIQQLESCGDCQACIRVCPICSVDKLSKEESNHFHPQAVSRWMLSCDGCGMCESVCARNLPLSIIFATIRNRLQKEYGYVPGRSIHEPLPVF